MTKARKWLAEWLRDAPAGEKRAETTLSAPAERIDASFDRKQPVHMAGTKIRADRLPAFLDHAAGGPAAGR